LLARVLPKLERRGAILDRAEDERRGEDPGTLEGPGKALAFPALGFSRVGR
jgi:hypothetical protein